MTRRPDEHHQVSSGRASEAAAGRLRGSLRREVGDLEVRLEEAQLRSDAFRSAGLDAEAAKVLEESREMVDAFHRRLESALAEAAVEREAERIFAGADDVVDVLGDVTVPGGIFSRIPAGVGAAVASLAVFAMAVVSLRAPTTRDVTVASDVTALPSPVASDEEPAGRTYSADVQRVALTLSPAELEVLAESPEPETVAPLLERRRKLLDRLRAEAGQIRTNVLAELDLLVEALRTEGVDVDRLMLLERVDQYRADDQDGQAPDDGVDDPATPEQDAEPQQPESQPEPQPEPEPEPSEEEEHDPVFPFGDEPSEEPSEGDGSSEAGASGTDNGEKGEDEGGILDR